MEKNLRIELAVKEIRWMIQHCEKAKIDETREAIINYFDGKIDALNYVLILLTD